MRSNCLQCRCAQISCYCSRVAPFESFPQFIILIHRREARRSVASGRMAHRFLSNSKLIIGTDFSQHPEVNALIAHPSYQPFLLYPSATSVPIEALPNQLRKSQRIPLVFVLDATWAQAKRMYRLSKNLQRLPQVHFIPLAPSRFVVRRQPKPHCVSTIEAVHRVIDIFDRAREPSHSIPREHDRLLTAFDEMVQKQVRHTERRNFRKLTVRGSPG